MLKPRHVPAAIAVASMLAMAGFVGSAQANVQIPGINGKIAFTSSRDFLVSSTALKGEQFSCQGQEGAGGDCELEIYSMNPDGTAQTRLTNNVVGDLEPAWSPVDGSTIAFTREITGECDLACSAIYTMPGGGDSAGTPQPVTDSSGQNLHASYSPDGSRIAYSGPNPDLQRAASRQILTFSVEFPNEIFTIPATGGTPTPLLPADQTGVMGPSTLAVDSYPAWSPDGTKVAFTRFTMHGPTQVAPKGITAFVDIRTYVAPANGSGPAQPVETYDVCQQATSPAVLDAALASSNPIRTLRQKGFTPPPGCNFDIKPAWSPDGTKIAVTRLSGAPVKIPSAPRGVPFGSDFGDIVVVDATTGDDIADLSNVTEPTDCNQDNDEFCSVDEYPSWSPDGTKIAFDSDRGSDGLEPEQCFGEFGFGCFNVWTMNADGSNPVQLTANSGDNFFPDWQRVPPPVPPPVTPPVTPATPPKVGVAGVRRACVSSSFHVRFHVATTASTVKRVVVKLDGKRIKSTTRSTFTLTINGKKLRSGRHRLTITATDSAGHVTTTHKSFSVCKAAKPRHKAAPRFTG